MIGGPLGYLGDHRPWIIPGGSTTHLKETENSGMLCLVPSKFEAFFVSFFQAVDGIVSAVSSRLNMG